MRKKLALLLLLVAPMLGACGSGGSGSAAAARPAAVPAGTGGATSARAAVETFLAAAKAQDVQGMSLIWGSATGPARNAMPKDVLEKREIVMFCYLRHDTYRIVDERAALNDQRRFDVELTLGNRSLRTDLMTVLATDGHWYVLSANLEPLSDHCAAKR